ASAPMPAPRGFQFISSFQLAAGSTPLAVTAQMAAPFPGLAAGTKVYLMRAGQLPDATGQMVPIWFEVEKAVVGADGFARTTSPPYSGVVDGGQYVWCDGATGATITTIRGQVHIVVPDVAATAIGIMIGGGLAAEGLGDVGSVGMDAAMDVSNLTVEAVP